MDSDSDSSSETSVTHSCYFPRDCAKDGSSSCVLTAAGNRCMMLTDETYEVEPVASSLERFVHASEEQPETLGGLLEDAPIPPSAASMRSYVQTAQSLLMPLVLRERVSLQEVQTFITVGTRAPSPPTFNNYKYEAYRQLYAAKYDQNQSLKAALGRLFNFMPDKPLFSRHVDGSSGVTALQDCGAIVQAHPLAGSAIPLDEEFHDCLDMLTNLLPLMQQGMALAQYSLWPANFAQQVAQEIALVRGVLERGIAPAAEHDDYRILTLRHRIDSLFASMQADYITLVQTLDEALRALAIVEMPISVTPLHPDTPPQPGEDARLSQTFTLGQWANGQWYHIRQALQGMPAEHEVPLEPWQRYFEGAFKQAIAQSVELNDLLYEKLFAQGGFTDAEAWKLAALVDATGILHLPDYAVLMPIHQQLLVQIQKQLEESQRHFWSNLGICALGIVGGAAAGFALGAPSAGAKIAGTVLCSIGAYYGVKEAQAIAQVLGNLHTLSFFGLQSGYASLIKLDDLSARFKWSLFFVGVDVIGAVFDAGTLARGVPELLAAAERSIPEAAARMARTWEQSYARHLLAGGPLQVAPAASEFTPHGELIRLASDGSPPMIMIRDPLLRGEIRTYITERSLSEAPPYWNKIPLSASVFYQSIWRSRTQLTADSVWQLMSDARSHLGYYDASMTQAGFYHFPKASAAANAILREHGLPNMLDRFEALAAQGIARTDWSVARVFPDDSVAYVYPHAAYPNTPTGRYISPAEPNAGWTAMADVLNRLRAQARSNPTPSDAVLDLLAEYAYIASGLLPFPRHNWGLFYQVMLQAYQIFGLQPRHSAALDHFMWAAASVQEAKLIFRAWYSGQLDFDIHQSAKELFRY